MAPRKRKSTTRKVSKRSPLGSRVAARFARIGLTEDVPEFGKKLVARKGTVPKGALLDPFPDDAPKEIHIKVRLLQPINRTTKKINE